MVYAIFADLVVVIHLAFVAFAICGGLLVLYRRYWAWFHVPSALWAVLVEVTGWICPLTPLENHFREKAGAVPYWIDFVEQYILPVLYPEFLTRNHQIYLGVFVMVLNMAVYGWILFRRRRQGRG
jgi:hypothetical protein